MTLREALLRINDENDLDRHAGILAELRESHGHRILLVAAQDLATAANAPNCVMYALGLEGRIDPPSDYRGHFYANTKFVQWLVEQGHLQEVDAAAIEPACLAVYRADGVVKHIGVAHSAARLRSKWGCGHIYEHNVLEVPANYGDSVAWYYPISVSQAYAWFCEWARAEYRR